MAASSDPRFGPVEPGATTSRGASNASAGAHDAARTAAEGSTAGAGASGPGGAGQTGGASTAETGTAGAMAGLAVASVAGAATFGFGALAGVALGAAAGVAAGDGSGRGQFTADADAHFRALYEASPERGRSYESLRAAYAFGYVAASEPGLAGRTFEEAEPALQEAWTDELRAKAGDWAGVRRYVHDAFGHARAEGLGDRRDRTVIGSAGSAVDPVELDRARHGLPSVTGLPEGEEYGTGVTPGTYE